MMLYHRLAIELLRKEALKRVANCGKVARRAVKGDAEGAVTVMIDNIDSATAACRTYLTAEVAPAARGKMVRGRK